MGRLDYNMIDRSRLSFNVRKHRLQPDQEQLLQQHRRRLAPQARQLGRHARRSLHRQLPPTCSTCASISRAWPRTTTCPARVSIRPRSGFPSYLAAKLRSYLQMPVISVQQQHQYAGAERHRRGPDPLAVCAAFASWVQIHGNHTLKFGDDDRQYRLNTFTAGSSTGTVLASPATVGCEPPAALRRR